MSTSSKTFKLARKNDNGRLELIDSATAGTMGGHRKERIYGRLDCPSALRWINRGHYVTHRVFFADETAAQNAGFRPCACCLPEDYKAWKAAQA